jgi:glycogen(starch) synthase
MKVLFVGPYPPPHGGVSVHVLSAHERMKRAGQQSNVLNIDPRAPVSNAYIKISGAADLVRQLFRHVSDEWTLSVHTNGHNPKSWLIALICGVAAQWGPSATLTLHSGGVPLYLTTGPWWRRLIARLACVMYGRIVCVNAEIARVLSTLGVPPAALEISPAFLPFETPNMEVPENIDRWMHRHSPMLSTAMFFRPEYGFELLLDAMTELRKVHPDIGCVVMGDGEHREEALVLLDGAGLREAVLLTGDLDHEVCLAVMASSDMFVRPTFMDGDSISVREAAALGVPVVASNVGMRPEGTMLFEVGNKSELVEQILLCSRGRRSADRQPAFVPRRQERGLKPATT